MKTTTAQTLKNRNTPFTWLVLLAGFFFFVPSLLMNKIWFNLESVTVEPVNIYGEPIEMTVEREILTEFRGYFTVDIRSAETGELIYQARPDGAFNYVPGKALPIPLYLYWWLGGVEKLVSAQGSGFTEGHFYIDTCHTVVVGVWNIPLARRCVQSNIFKLIKPEEVE